MKIFHNLVRGLIIENGHVLVVHARGASNTFLPGGHIEVGESAVTALKREFREESGREVVVDRFLGCVEHGWDENGKSNYEINHIFLLKDDELTHDIQLASLESHLEFIWVPVSKLSKNNILPAPLIEFISGMPANLSGSWWASTLKC